MKKMILAIMGTVLVIIAVSAQAEIDWDIYEDTTIADGSYNLVRVDYNNPSGNTMVDMYGGSIYVMEIFNSATTSFAGGSIYSLYTLDTSAFTFSGGSMSYMRAYNDSEVVISGTNFNFELGEITAISGRLTGMLDSGETIQLNFERYDNASIMLVPEPCTVSLLLLGCTILRIKQKI